MCCMCLSVSLRVSLHPYDFQDALANFRPTWQEEKKESLADAEYLKFYEAGQLEGAIKCDKYYLQK